MDSGTKQLIYTFVVTGVVVLVAMLMSGCTTMIVDNPQNLQNVETGRSATITLLNKYDALVQHGDSSSRTAYFIESENGDVYMLGDSGYSANPNVIAIKTYYNLKIGNKYDIFYKGNEILDISEAKQ